MTAEISAEKICQSLNIDYSQILNIYPYGSKIYGSTTEDSDDDYVIVYKTSFLPSGAFKDNAISSEDRKIQGTCYSRGGFIDAINNYQITALECLYLPDEFVVQKKMNFKMYKFDKKEFCKKIIEQASGAWYRAKQSHKQQNTEYTKKNIFHAIRILDFGLQIEKSGNIYDYGSQNNLKVELENLENFKFRIYVNKFMKMLQHIKYKK